MEELKTLLLVDGIVSLKVAKLLKKHDFHERCRTYYNTSVEMSYTQSNPWDYNEDYNFFVSAPTLSLAQQWLRVKYGINVFIVPKYIHMCLHHSITIIRVNNSTKKFRWGEK